MIETQEHPPDSDQSPTQHLLDHGHETIRYVSHREEFKQITGDLPSAILLTQIVFYASRKGWGSFYKFNQPCEHELYQEGDSWTEEFGWSYYQLSKARGKIATKNTTGGDPKAILQGDSMDSLVMYWTDRSNVTSYYLNKSLLDECLQRLYEGRPMPWDETEEDAAENEAAREAERAAESRDPAQGDQLPFSAASESETSSGSAEAPEVDGSEAAVDNSFYDPPFKSLIGFGDLNSIREWDIEILSTESSLPSPLQQIIVDRGVNCRQPVAPAQNGRTSNNGSSPSSGTDATLELLRRRARTEKLCDEDVGVPVQRKLLSETQTPFNQYVDRISAEADRLDSLTLALTGVIGPQAQRRDARKALTAMARQYPIRWVVRAFVVAAFHYEARAPLAYMQAVLGSWNEAQVRTSTRHGAPDEVGTTKGQSTRERFEAKWENMDVDIRRSIRGYILKMLPDQVTRRILEHGAEPVLSDYPSWPYSAQREFEALLVRFVGDGQSPR